MPAPTIYAKLIKIMEECGALNKDKKNEFHGYKYASEEIIKKTIQPLLISHNVHFQVEIPSSTTTEVIKETKNGKKTSFKTELSVVYTFTDAETGDQLKGTFVGFGEDESDKGLYKAITGAIKYIITSNFLIPTGEDVEKSKKSPGNGQSTTFLGLSKKVDLIKTKVEAEDALAKLESNPNPKLSSDEVKTIVGMLKQKISAL